jgi:hypothetical protein
VGSIDDRLTAADVQAARRARRAPAEIRECPSAAQVLRRELVG